MSVEDFWVTHRSEQGLGLSLQLLNGSGDLVHVHVPQLGDQRPQRVCAVRDVVQTLRCEERVRLVLSRSECFHLELDMYGQRQVMCTLLRYSGTLL